LPTKTERKAGLQRQIERLQRRIEGLNATSDRLSGFRLLVVVVGVTTLAVLFFIPSLRAVFWLALLLFGGGFIALVVVHRRVLLTIREHTLWQRIKQTHIARMEIDWSNLPRKRIQATAPHDLETDLDLINLHRLLDTTVSRAGAARLRARLLPLSPDIDDIHQRQRRVADLIPQSRFRDKLTLYATAAAEDIREGAEGQTLLTWLQSEQPPTSIRPTLLILSALAVANIVGLGLAAVGLVPEGVPLLTFIAYAAIFIARFQRIQSIFEDSLTIEGALRRLDAVMRFLERDQYATMPVIHELVQPILSQKPSRQLRRATGVISGASLRANPILWLIINALVPWDYYFGLRLDALKEELAAQLPGWLDVWHELEVLSALATFGYLNPSNTFPDITDDQESPIYRAESLGHPLITNEERVTNSFTFSDLGEIVVITGSNMAGKSSFLRTLGINLCLAYSGAPVVADALHTSLFRLYTSIRVTDSLDDGISYFYAEVRRLKGLLQAVEADEAQPVFFLIDEIFRGTNNRERLIGSRSFIRALAGSHSVGLIATHDLELVSLSDENPSIRNAHFREDVQAGRMVFDYILRPGPSPTTNALRIMAMEGLPVEREALPEDIR